MDINIDAVQGRLPAVAGNKHPGPGKLKEACRDFEALFVAQMLKVMREATENQADELALNPANPFQELFDWELAKKLSENSPLGVRETLMRNFELRGWTESNTSPDAAASPPLQSRGGLGGGYLSREVSSTRLSPGIESMISRASRRHSVDAELVRAVIACESGGDVRAVSPKGAKGLMQLMDSTAAEMGVADPFDPQANIDGGTAYLKLLLDRYPGDIERALAAYNAGPSAVDRWDGIPPYPETQRYVHNVLSIYRSLPGRGDASPEATAFRSER